MRKASYRLPPQPSWRKEGGRVDEVAIVSSCVVRNRDSRCLRQTSNDDRRLRLRLRQTSAPTELTSTISQ